MFSYDEILEKIEKDGKISRQQAEKLIGEKQTELSGLVSREGAAYIVGRELGLNLLKEGTRDLKIKNLVAGLRSANISGKIARIFEPREFDKNGKKGRLLSMIIGDETGTTRLTLWN